MSKIIKFTQLIEEGGSMSAHHQMYESLLSSIDFFSQNLNLNQIIEYGFSIFNSFEQPAASAIYTMDDAKETYQVQFHFGYTKAPDAVVKTDQHAMFAVRNGFLLTDYKTQSRYFEEAFLDAYTVSKIMPLIIDDQLYGFIISSDAESSIYDISFLNRFNYLMNLSLEKASRYLERNALKQEIDKRIFNLDSISQTMKLLLSELKTKGIIQLSADVIRELTSSSVTAIALYDAFEQAIKVEAYEDLVSGNKAFQTFHLNEEYPTQQTVFKYPQEADKLSVIFKDASHFEALKPTYVILIIKEEIIGFVTLGEPLTQKPYEEDLIHRIQDITSIMYIALTNAHQFEVISEQKSQLKRHLNVLETMNRITKTVSSADSIEDLSDMVITALNTSFGIEKAIFTIFKEDRPQIMGALNMETSHFDDVFFAKIQSILEDYQQTYYTLESFYSDLGDALGGYFEHINCFVLTPIFLNGLTKKPIGFILVTNARDRLHDTQVHMIEILSNSIGPLLNQLLIVEDYSEHYIPEPLYNLQQGINAFHSDLKLYDIPFSAYIKKLQQVPFQEIGLQEYSGFKTVLYQNYVVVLSQTEVPKHLYDVSSGENPLFEDVKELIVALS